MSDSPETQSTAAIGLVVLRLKTEEGFRSKAYRDTNGHLTIGYGFNLDAGITPRAATALLAAQATETHEALGKFDWYRGLDPVRQSALVDIAFNEGVGGLLHFPHMIAALARGDWAAAQAECKVQDPKLAARYQALGALLLAGQGTPQPGRSS